MQTCSIAGNACLRRASLALIAAAALGGCGGDAGAPLEQPAASGSAQQASLTDFTPGSAWVARHGMTSDQYQDEFNTWVGKGYRLTYVSGYTVGGDPRFAAVWEWSEGPAWVARHGMTADQYQQEFDAQTRAGYRLVLVNGYSVGGSDRYVAIWEQRSGPAWIARHGMTDAQYQQEFDAQVAAGYRLVHVSGYEVAGQARYAAIWEQRPGPAWVARHGLTADQYQHEFDAQVAAGFRLLHVSGYAVGGTPLYAGIWEQSPSSRWMAFHGVPGASYQAKFDELARQGYRPVEVNAYAATGGEQFAGIFMDDLSAMDRVAVDAMTKYKLPALSVAITKDGRLVYAKAYGTADQAANTPATVSTLFRIASDSKPITSVAIQRLVEQGLVGYDDHVFGPGSLLGTRYGTHWNDNPLPASYRTLESVTVRHLLTHTGGGWTNDGTDPMFTNPTMSQADLITWTLDNRPLANAPGTTYAYSNFGYCVLGRVIEAVTGQGYADWVKANVLTPVGIADMTIAGDTLASRLPNEAVYYSSTGENPYGMQVARMDSHGGWLATATDLVRLAVRVDGFATKPDILSSATITTMTTPWAPGQGYAMGWAVNTLGNWWHTGSLPGTSSILVRTSGGFTWAAITNSRDNGVDLDTMMWDMVNAATSWTTADLF
jgi:CubicO group peptidase (beta-lactamase class C family)